MAKVKVVGNALVVTSALKSEEIKTVAKYQPKALTLYGGEDGKDPVFRIAVTAGAGSLNDYGVEFNTESRDGGFAQVTLVCEMGENPKAFVADKFGGALANLNALEASVSGVLGEIEEQRRHIMDSIEVE